MSQMPPIPQQAPTRKTSSRRTQVIVGISILLLIGVGTWVKQSSGTEPSPRPTPLTSSPSLSPSTSPSPVTTVTPTPTTSTIPPTQLFAKMQVWSLKSAPSLRVLATDLTKISSDLVNSDDKTLAASCTQFKHHIETAQKVSLPSPDPDINSNLTKELSLFHQGAVLCIKGANTNNEDEINQAGELMIQGARYTNAILDALDTYVT